MSADSSVVLLLQEARRGAQRALETLLRQRRELSEEADVVGGGRQRHASLTAQQRAEGQRAADRAIEAARRALEQIDADLRAASTSD